MPPCPHNPALYDLDPRTADVWCFHCSPPRNVSREQRDAELIRQLRETIAQLMDEAAERQRRLENSRLTTNVVRQFMRDEAAECRRQLEDARLRIHAQRLMIRRLEAVNADLRQQNAHLLDQPLVILNGDAFIGQRSVSRPCPN